MSPSESFSASAVLSLVILVIGVVLLTHGLVGWVKFRLEEKMENERPPLHPVLRHDFLRPDYRSELIINENLTIKFLSPIPNAWFRFWTKVILGWKWQNLAKRQPNLQRTNDSSG